MCDVNVGPGYGGLAEHTQVSFTVHDTLDSVYMCYTVRLCGHRALIVRDFQGLLRSIGVFHLNGVSKWNGKSALGNTHIQ